MARHRNLKMAGAAAAVALGAAALVAIPALATPGIGFNAVDTWKGVFGPMDIKSEGGASDFKLKTHGNSDVYVVRNAVDAGGTSGWHRHPGPSLITITEGEITAYESTDPDCAPVVYTQGQGFVDDGHHAHMLRNETGEPAETVAVQFLPPGAGRRINEPQPAHCPA